jgi:hypothetical protein
MKISCMCTFNATAVLESTYGRNVNWKVASIPTPPPASLSPLQPTQHQSSFPSYNKRTSGSSLYTDERPLGTTPPWPSALTLPRYCAAAPLLPRSLGKGKNPLCCHPGGPLVLSGAAYQGSQHWWLCCGNKDWARLPEGSEGPNPQPHQRVHLIMLASRLVISGLDATLWTWWTPSPQSRTAGGGGAGVTWKRCTSHLCIMPGGCEDPFWTRAVFDTFMWLKVPAQNQLWYGGQRGPLSQLEPRDPCIQQLENPGGRRLPCWLTCRAAGLHGWRPVYLAGWLACRQTRHCRSHHGAIRFKL